MAETVWAWKILSPLSFTWNDPISYCPLYSFRCGRKMMKGGLRTSKSINCANKRTFCTSIKLMQLKELHYAIHSSLTAWMCWEMLRMRQLIPWPIISTGWFSRDKFLCEDSIRQCVAIRTTYPYPSPGSSLLSPSQKMVSYCRICQKKRDRDAE